MWLIEINPFVGIGHVLQESFEIRTGNHQRSGVFAGVEAQTFGVLQLFVQEEVHVVFRVVDESERRYRTGFHAEVFHQSLLRGEAQFALVQLFLDVVDVHVLVAVEADQIVLVALVVAEEKVLAVFRVVSGPILLGNLDGRGGRMLQIFVWNVQFVQKLV